MTALRAHIQFRKIWDGVFDNRDDKRRDMEAPENSDNATALQEGQVDTTWSSSLHTPPAQGSEDESGQKK